MHWLKNQPLRNKNPLAITREESISWSKPAWLLDLRFLLKALFILLASLHFRRHLSPKCHAVLDQKKKSKTSQRSQSTEVSHTEKKHSPFSSVICRNS